MALEDRWWCLEGCGFVDKDHRCEQWCQTVRIPKEAQARILDEAAERGIRRAEEIMCANDEEVIKAFAWSKYESNSLRAAIKGE